MLCGYKYKRSVNLLSVKFDVVIFMSIYKVAIHKILIYGTLRGKDS